MKISFVIPAYNEEVLIPQTLEAMLGAIAESNCEAEIIVVNNASTDRTGEVAGSYEKVIVVEEPRKGLTRARQAGFEASSGELIANIDADTHVSAEWIGRVLREFESNEGLAALSGPFVYHDLPVYHQMLVEKLFYTPGYALHLLNQHVLHTGAMIQGGNFVARRDALEKIGGFDTSIDFYGEDTDTARRLSKVGLVRWSFKLRAHSSGRRLKQDGLILASWRYAANYLSSNYAGKPVHTTHEDIRLQ